MSFLALKKDSLTDDEDKFKSDEYKIFFSPLPDLQAHKYPVVWLDLHLSGDYYEICGKDLRLNFKRQNGVKYVSIPPGRGFRFITNQKIGVKKDVIAIIVNSAGNAVKGLYAAPGKVDPGFLPDQLTLVMTNQSKRSIDLKVGDKIATIAFAQVSGECAPYDSIGWAKRRIDDGYSKTCWDRFKSMWTFDLFIKIIYPILIVSITLAGNYFIQYYIR
jgi:dUTPase